MAMNGAVTIRKIGKSCQAIKESEHHKYEDMNAEHAMHCFPRMTTLNDCPPAAFPRNSLQPRTSIHQRSSPLKAQPKQSQRVSSALLMSEGHPREAYGALREKKLLGRGSRPESYRYTWGNRALTGGVGARAARHGSSQLNLTGAISWVRDMVGLSSTETPNANRGTGKFFRRSQAASRPPQ
ncbi:unnamed protein product [Vicia faba]|uniref:Uncharacterized protein n=1 Tax=Vicia faba TaxID=3906 RepID=A0AAV1ADL9_VICFA|nr:unnamed protein product [Vicia faba]